MQANLLCNALVQVQRVFERLPALSRVSSGFQRHTRCAVRMRIKNENIKLDCQLRLIYKPPTRLKKFTYDKSISLSEQFQTMTKRSHFRGFVLAFVALVLMGFGTPRSVAQGQTLRPPTQGRMVTLGRLIRSGQSSNGTPRFALLDDEGTLTSYVIPNAGINIASYVNQEVAVTVRRSRSSANGIRYLLAESIKPMGRGLDMPGPEVTPTIGGQTPDRIPALAAQPIPAETYNALPSVMEAVTPRLQPIPAGRYDEPMAQVGYEEETLFWDDAPDTQPTGSGYSVQSEPAIQRTSHESIVGGPIYDEGYLSAPGDGGSYGHSCTSCGSDVGGGCGNCGSMGACGSACCPCGPSGRFWIRGEYLLWWTKGMDLPPLVTTTNGNPLPQNAGVLGANGTNVLYGDNEIFDESRGGYRVRFGTWLDQCHWKGIEFDYFRLEDETDSFSRTSVGNPILARPFFNSNLNREDSELVAFPGLVSGTINVRADTEFMSFSPRFRCNLRCENFVPEPACGCGQCNACGDTACSPMGGQRVDFTLGYRHMSLDERLRITEQLTSTQNGTASTFNLNDTFATENSFNGAEIGIVWEYYRGPWSMEFFSRFGLGNSSRKVRIQGSTDSAVQGASFTDVGGLLALPSNIGTYEDDEFVVIPELGINLGYQIAPSMRFLVGYTFLYWNSVVRPGDQIDMRVNTDLLPPAIDTTGLDVPSFAFNDSSFWAQGLSLGLDWRW